MAPQKIHVAVLDADIPCLSVYAKRGLYSSQFKNLLQAAASRLNKSHPSLADSPLSLHITAFDAVGGTLPPLECLRTTPVKPSEAEAEAEAAIPQAFTPIDAILITGSAASAYDPHPWIADLEKFIQVVHDEYPLIKMFGSCFGHQIIAQALLSARKEVGLGLDLDTEPKSESKNTSFSVQSSPSGYEMGIQPITLNPEFTSYFPNLSSNSPFTIQLIHSDIVAPAPASPSITSSSSSLPKPWLNIGSSKDCTIQGLYLPHRILTYQGHFEFDAWVNAELCIEFARRGNWPDDVVKGYIEDINRSVRAGQKDGDDSEKAGEAVVILFAGLDGGEGGGNPGGIKNGFLDDVNVNGVEGGNGLLTPPLER